MPSSNYKWVVAGLLLCAGALNYADRTAVTAVFPLLRAELGMSDVALGATLTAFLWTYAIASPFAGALGDRHSRARILTMSLGAWSLIMALTALVQTATQLLMMRGLLGFAEAAYIPAATALIADHHGPDTRAKAIGMHIAGLSVGMIGGGAMAGYLGDRVGWRPSLVLLGCMGLILTAVCWRVLRDSESRPAVAAADRRGLARQFLRLVRVPSYLVLTFDVVFTGAVNWVFINWLPLFFQETFALSLAMAGFYGNVFLQSGRIAGLSLGGFPSDRAARRHPRYRMLIMALCYLAAAPLLLNFATFAPWNGNFTVIAASIAGFTFLVGAGYVNAQPLLCEFLPERMRSTGIGFMNMSATIVGGAGVILAGALKSSFGLANAFASLAAIQVCVALVLLAAFVLVLPRDLEKAGRGPA